MGATNVLGKFAGDQCLDEGGDATATQMFDETETYFKTAADGAAATATTDQWMWTNNTGGVCSVISAIFWPSASVTADNTNFATLQIKVDNGIGGASAVALSMTTAITDSGNLTALATKALTLRTGANATIAAGATVYFAITKSGAGVVIPISAVTVRIRKVN